MPIVIDGITKIQQKFFHSLMATSNSLALSQLWLVGISVDDMRAIDTQCEDKLKLYEGATHKWDIFNDSKLTFSDRWFIGNTFYMLAQTVRFPGDSLSVSHVGVNQSGALKGLIGENRNDLPNVTIAFLETNQSVGDLFFRPWMITLGFKSLKYQKLRKPVKLLSYQKDGVSAPLKLRKTITLEACAPITIDSEEYNYTGDKVIRREIEFVYNRYYIDATAGPGHTNQNELLNEYNKLASKSGVIKPTP